MNPKALGLLIAVICAVLFIYFCMFIGSIVLAAGNCTAKYAEGTEVTLTATPCPGSYFVRWEGACAGQSAVCKVKMDGDKQTAAVFELLPCEPFGDGCLVPNTYTLPKLERYEWKIN